MPQIRAQGQTLECAVGDNLRHVLLRHDIDLYNGAAKWINCHSLGTCGTCSVVVSGPVSDLTWKEKARLSLPPHLEAKSLSKNRRMACQVKVLGDVEVTKYDQFWGEGDHVVWSGS